METRPFKVKLSPRAAQMLGQVALNRRAEMDYYQIGVGTIAAELIESLTTQPTLVAELLGTENKTHTGTDSKVVYGVAQKPKKSGVKTP